MCNNNGMCGCFGGGNNWWWIIILILLFCNCGGNNMSCNTGWNTGCERDNCGCC